MYRISHRGRNYLQNNSHCQRIYPRNSIADGGGSFVASATESIYRFYRNSFSTSDKPALNLATHLRVNGDTRKIVHAKDVDSSQEMVLS